MRMFHSFLSTPLGLNASLSSCVTLNKTIIGLHNPHVNSPEKHVPI